VRAFACLYEPLIRFGAGFALEQILEPQPTEAFKQKAPEDYETLSRSPGFMCVRAIKKENRP
jgi:hypothetical protein